MSRPINRRSLLAAMILCAALAAGQTRASTGAADLILTHGRVYTDNAKSRWAEAVAVKGGKIIYVGSSAGAKAKRGPNTKEIDLGGRLLLPGLFDTHNHADGRTGELNFVQLGNQLSPHTLEGYRQKILAFRASHPDAKQLRGTGFDGWILPAIAQSRKRQPRQLLDDIVSDIPVYIESWTGHMGWVNTKALELTGITKDTPDPPGRQAKFDRDPATGEPDGMLQEAAMDFMITKLPEPYLTVEQYRAGILSFERDIAAPNGVTGVLIPTAQPAENFDVALQQLSDEGKLGLHYSAAQWSNDQLGVKQVPELVAGRARFHGGPYIKFNVIKILAPWAQAEELNQTIAALDKQGFQVFVHQTGPTENYASVLDAFEYALKQNGRRDSRHIITHNRGESAPLAARFKALGVRGDADWNNKPDWYLAAKASIEEGVPFTLSTDYPVRPVSYLFTELAECAKHGLALEALIDSITIRGAEALFIEKKTGSITVGKAADMIVMDKDLFKIAPAEIESAKVLLTLFAGKELYRDSSF